MAPHSPSPPTPPPKDIPRRSRLGTLERLPNEILCDIISYVPPDDISELRASCKFLNELVKVNEPQIARGIIDLRYPFLKAKIMPYGPVDPVDQLGDEVLVRASPMNPMWFFDMVVAQRMHICHCRECLSKMDTIFLCLDWWEETRKLRARIAPRVTNASAKTSKKLR
ncbi:hypothetical protein BU16DRAFT_91217 [Lophium mytilinum]|uniref:F-box domain-containing protein n=1 Tax=Lophium mytilinum TaxID=390894 RepID=A0A6A6QLF2_9PEZI|nr:hypothetical protein BU16DRAFT_91217 [Lophium mytilinum]